MRVPDIEVLLGPAGSGKTHACLAQVGEALALAEGPPLLWIAPKQFTFQLEREVLAQGIPGFTRLEILPFDRLARRVLDEVKELRKDVLTEEGRVMVLHALLREHAARLTAFRPSARGAGFATQLSRTLRELHGGGLSAARLRRVSASVATGGSLAAKLEDLAYLQERYREWLEQRGLRDPDDLLPRAAEALGRARQRGGQDAPAFAGLWLDGFAEMTEPELDLLAALLPFCERATLAFCLAPSPAGDGSADPLLPAATPGAGLLWGVTAATCHRCVERLRGAGWSVRVRALPADGAAPPRFRSSPVLGGLASAWTGMTTGGAAVAGAGGQGVQFVECVDPEAEALLAVRLINRHVREAGGRYRDVSVIVRHMEGYGEVVQRAFRRHGIPCFADHREPMGHHPVAELTRSALGLAAGGWGQAGWVSALKSGLVVEDPGFADQLENAGLAGGLRGDEWMRLEEYRMRAGLTADAVRSLEPVVAAFARFRAATSSALGGAALANALRSLWAELRVPETLERWQAEAGDLPPLYRAIHHTAWEQIVAWCEALELAFGDTALALREWHAVAEAGLSRLTLGVIPPALDQVLLGAVDRMRQPEVQLTLVLGVNEGVFPAAPASPGLLHPAERQLLAGAGLNLGWTRLELAAREHYYAYIACTRPSRQLCLSWSRRGLEGQEQVRSSIAARVLALAGLASDQVAVPGDIHRFDGQLKSFAGELRPAEALTLAEWLECPGWDRSLSEPSAAQDSVVAATLANLRARCHLRPSQAEAGLRLEPAAVAALHPGGILVSSVSALEDFAECPFRHFAGRELRLQERDEFRADAAGMGTLLHAILKEFHERTCAERGSWRRWQPGEAARLVEELGEALLEQAPFAPLTQDPLAAWETRHRLRGLAAMIEQAIAWMATYAFDPVAAEVAFGEHADGPIPAWTLPLEGNRTLKLRGRIDRLDVGRTEEGLTLVAVFDYKSAAQSPHAAKLEQGLELQLLAYLAFAAESAELRQRLGVELAATARPPITPEARAGIARPAVRRPAADGVLEPAGAFYVPLAPNVSLLARDASPEDLEQGYLDSLTHLGRGNQQWLSLFDSAAAQSGTRARSRQFKPRQFVSPEVFHDDLTRTVSDLRRHAAAILDGTVSVAPIRYAAGRTACDYCPYRALCRFEPLRGGFRPLVRAPRVPARPPSSAGSTAGAGWAERSAPAS